MTEEQRAALTRALGPAEMGAIAATKTMQRLRANGTTETITIEIGIPQPIDVPYPPDPENATFWSCTARISGVPRTMAATGISSLDAILGATYLIAAVLAKLPYAAEIDMSLLPNFGLPLNPITTTPAQLDAEQTRHKELKVDAPRIIPAQAESAQA